MYSRTLIIVGGFSFMGFKGRRSLLLRNIMRLVLILIDRFKFCNCPCMPLPMMHLILIICMPNCA